MLEQIKKLLGKSFRQLEIEHHGEETRKLSRRFKGIVNQVEKLNVFLEPFNLELSINKIYIDGEAAQDPGPGDQS